MFDAWVEINRITLPLYPYITTRDVGGAKHHQSLEPKKIK